MSQLWKVRLPDGRVLTPGDWTSSEPLYSVVEVASGAIQTLQAFAYGKGGSVPGSVGPRQSRITDTNLEGEGGKIPENEELVAYTLQIEAFMIGEAETDTMPLADPPDVSLADMLRLQRDLVVVTKIASIKRYTQAPMGYFPAATGTYRYNSADRTVVSDAVEGAVVANNGGTSVQDRRVFASPLYAGPGDVFSVDVIPAPGSVSGLSIEGDTRIRLRLYFNGYRRRPVA